MKMNPVPEVNEIRKILTILLAGLVMIMATAAVVYAEEEESDEEDGQNSMPGFELALALASLGAARLAKS